MVRVRRVASVLLVVMAFSAVGFSAFGAEQSTRPPKRLHKYGDHWTPYNPPDPATFPPGSKVHVIVAGDTLWGLAAQFYGNGYLWPQLWEANTYITDAHWIYPGDPLLVSGETAPVATDTGTETAVSSDTEGETTMDLSPSATAGGAPIALGNESDVFCFGYLGAEEEALPVKITSFEDTDMKYNPYTPMQVLGVADGDIVFIEGGSAAGLVAGETYLVVRPDEIIRHPNTKEVLGRHYDFRGRVRILCTSEDRATAIVVQSCKDMVIGDRLKPMPSLPIPLARLTQMSDVCSPASGKTAGLIVNAKDFHHALGEGQVIQINLGRDDFVQPGDFLTVYRENAVAGYPRQILGEIGVLTAEPHTATAKIVRMRYSMEVGDRVELK